jgi:hypothetical protein
MRASGTDLPELRKSETLAFIPERDMTAAELRRILAEGEEELRAWAVTRMLLYAEWEEIWTYVTREQVVELFPRLDLPPALRTAWARILRLEAVETAEPAES